MTRRNLAAEWFDARAVGRLPDPLPGQIETLRRKFEDRLKLETPNYCEPKGDEDLWMDIELYDGDIAGVVSRLLKANFDIQHAWIAEDTSIANRLTLAAAAALSNDERAELVELEGWYRIMSELAAMEREIVATARSLGVPAKRSWWRRGPLR